MIIAITDAKGFTNKVEETINEGSNVSIVYKSLFEDHIESIGNVGLEWKIIKTTGDGLLITVKPKVKNQQFFINWINVMYKLYQECECHELRILAHWCDNTKVITNLTLAINSTTNFDLKQFLEHLPHDIFGSEINLLFRLAQMVSASTFVLTDDFISNIVNNDQEKQSFMKKEKLFKSNLVFGPAVPITYVKGINQIGFSTEKFRGEKKKPFWVWEVKSNAVS